MKTTHSKNGAPKLASVLALCSLLALAACCDDCDDGKQGPPGPPGDGGEFNPDLGVNDDPPGVNIAVLDVTGGSLPGGNFQPGDTVRVKYTVETDSGTTWDTSLFSRGRIMLSGPTFNYQRVLPQQNDLATASVQNNDDSYTYTFADPLPDVYAAPYNDTPDFDADDGELTGQPLLDGTYTVGLYFTWDYTAGGDDFRDVGNTTEDLLVGGSVNMTEPRDVVTQANCNQCHEELQAHGGQRRDVTLCLLCHTAGSEDRNDPAVAGGTPGASVDFKIMIHKIHSGVSLPSVQGVATNADGSRNYGVPPMPYELVGFGNNIHDYSEVQFPVFPNALYAMPKDLGYSALAPSEQDQEDSIRTGPTSCASCHGDPDGAGPLPPPAQGNLALAQPARNTCGSCHDDIDWDLPYSANGATMPPQFGDGNCTLCHPASGNSLASFEGHLHPLDDPSFNPGLHFDLMDLQEAGSNDGDDTIDPGEKVEVTLTVLDDAGLDVDVSAELASLDTAVSGPTSNYNLLLNADIPTAGLTGPQPYVFNLPELYQLEFVGDATGVVDSFMTEVAPHWNVAGADTMVWERTGAPITTTLTAPVEARQNFVDVGNSVGFARDDYVVLNDGAGVGLEEYLQIQWVDGNRLWFSSPYSQGYKAGTHFAHNMGATVKQVTLMPLTEGVDYDLVEATGTIDELGNSWGGGHAIVVTYTSDFVMPADYPLTLNDSPDLGLNVGEWRSQALVDGTYTAGVWGYRDLSLNLFGETNDYRGSGDAVGWDFLAGSATVEEPYDLISSGNDCLKCHQQMWFHGGSRRGWTSCLLCHGNAGTEDRPQYVAPNAPDTTSVTVNFRTMLHKIHQGKELANASTYTVVGFGLPFLYPNNFTPHTYEAVGFPAMPDGTQSCAMCHGATNDAWKEPSDRNYPGGQPVPLKAWTVVCAACHDDSSATAHIAANTAPDGAESCDICHSTGDVANVETVHKVR